uniref:COS domain-containing protein n=1 Tax=Anopheles culicifacies TaxID=139723 RepID=A0A182MBQ6_9DIPT
MRSLKIRSMKEQTHRSIPSGGLQAQRWVDLRAETILRDGNYWLTELSHNLQQLSEKARSTTEFIQRLKGMSDKVTDTCIEFERLVTVQCEALIAAINARRDVLLDVIRSDKEAKIRTLKDQQASCTGKLQQTTGLIQFCIEALKETDSAAFLQVGSMLINRVANTDMTWHQEVTNAAPRVSPIIDLTLDDSSVIRAIDNLNFIQMKRKYPYG